MYQHAHKQSEKEVERERGEVGSLCNRVGNRPQCVFVYFCICVQYLPAMACSGALWHLYLRATHFMQIVGTAHGKFKWISC